VPSGEEQSGRRGGCGQVHVHRSLGLNPGFGAACCLKYNSSCFVLLQGIFCVARSRLGVRHRMSRGRRRITTIPLQDMFSELLKPSIGRQIRRAENYGFVVLDNPLAKPV
jgi:hypothetical protein